jgi:PAS domain S-box-containing protein
MQALPFNVLKVDRSFVSTMTSSKESRKIVAAVIGLGQSLGLTTVAEGIETPEQNEMVDWLGCAYGQGWFHGRPVPCEALADTCMLPRAKNAPKQPLEDLQRRSVSRFDTLPYVRLAQLRSVYDAVPVGLAFFDNNERYVSINRRLADINGAGMVDHLGRTMKEMIPNIYPQVGPNMKRALAGESVMGTIVIGQPDPAGQCRDFLVSYEPARDEGGEVVGVSIAVLEINSLEAHRSSSRHNGEQ